MRDFNKTVAIERFNIGKVKMEDLGREIYRKGVDAVKGLMESGGDKKTKLLDCHCSQSYVREFVNGNVEYAGLDMVNASRDGKIIVPEIKAEINSIPLKDRSVDMVWAVGQKLGYGANHQSVFEMERIIRPGGYLVVSLSKFWFLREYNQLLFLHRAWQYVKAVEIKYIIDGGSEGEEAKDTAKYFAVYQHKA